MKMQRIIKKNASLMKQYGERQYAQQNNLKQGKILSNSFNSWDNIFYYIF